MDVAVPLPLPALVAVGCNEEPTTVETQTQTDVIGEEEFAAAYLEVVPSARTSSDIKTGAPTWGESVEAVHFAYTLAHYASYLEEVPIDLPPKALLCHLNSLKEQGMRCLSLKEFVTAMQVVRGFTTEATLNPLHFLGTREAADRPEFNARRTCFPNVLFDETRFLKDVPPIVASFWTKSAIRNRKPGANSVEGVHFYNYAMVYLGLAPASGSRAPSISS